MNLISYIQTKTNLDVSNLDIQYWSGGEYNGLERSPGFYLRDPESWPLLEITFEQIVTEWELEKDALMLASLKEMCKEKLVQIVDAFPLLVFSASPEKIQIYQRKQQLVNGWAVEGLPIKVEVEWQQDWALRNEFVAQGWVPVGALNKEFKCHSAEELWRTWELNTALANELDIYSEPIRTKYQALIDNAASASEIDQLVQDFKDDLDNLVVNFMINKAPGLIATSGLEEVAP